MNPPSTIKNQETINLSFNDYERIEQNLFICNKLLELSEKGVFCSHYSELNEILNLLISEASLIVGQRNI